MNKPQQDAHIKVICRMRPLNELEKTQGGQCCVVYNQKAIKLKIQGDDTNYEFTFDRIFGPESTQKEVFHISAQSVIDSVMNGYNGTIFAYGQTSSGKTHTMEGPSLESDEQKGIIPRMMDSVFNHIVNADENLEFTVKISFLEIYNEKIQDLLDPRKTNLHIKEDKSKGIFVQDATEIYVNSVENMKKVMKTGAENRTIAATRMNERSSRSHSIFILSIVQKDIRIDNIKQSKLYFVDLAGSEKISKTNVTGQQLEEAKNINKSLSALGNVINALTSTKPEHVPYRDSKLTRILQESLGGNSKTTLIIACSMCSYNDKETLGTFRFGNRAKSIKNKPIVNVERSAKELQQLLETAEKTIKKQEEIIQKIQMQLDNGSNMETTSLNSSIAFLDNSNLIKLEKIEKGELISSLSNHNLSVDIPNEIDLIKEIEGSLKESPKNEGESFRLKDLNEMEKINNLKKVSKGNVTLTILKQHIHIVAINEEIKGIKQDKKELEAELLNKNHEIYELNEKLLMQEENYINLLPKYEGYLQKLQINLEQLYHENQDFSNNFFEIRTEISLFKDELTNIMINNSLFSIETSKNEDSEIINERIQKILKMIEIIEKFTDNFKGSKENYSAHCTQISEELSFSKKLITEEQYNLRSTLSDENQTGKSENLSAQLPKRITRLPNKLFHIMSKNGGKEEEKYITTEPDEESKSNRNGSENSPKLYKEKTHESIFKARVEADKSYDEIVSKLNKMENNEDKLIQLHELVVNQRKTIDNLTKTNQDLTITIDTNNNTIDSRILKYKSEINELSKYSLVKLKDYDKKIENLQKSINEKQTEIKTLKKKNEKDLLQKNHQLCEIKVNFDKLQKIINGNNNLKKVYDLEAKLRDLGTERQKLFNDVYKLRAETDQKDDILSEKDYQIHLLQNNINTLANQLDTLKFINDSQYNVCLNQQSRVRELEEDIRKSENHNRIANNHQKNKKSIASFLDKNIIKPIKGGGGNLSNFQRKNFLTEDPEKMDLNLKIPSGLKIKGLTDMIETKSNSNEKKEETFKKMELQQQQTPSFFNNIKSFFL